MLFLRRYFPYITLAGLALISIGIWSAVFAATPSGVLTFAVLNIGQGDGLYIESPTGVRMLVDGGPGTGALLSELPKVMPFADRELDAIIETHPDSDHMGGFVDLLKRYKVDNFIEPGIIKHNITTDTLEAEVASEKIPKYIARRGMWLDLGGGARLDILFPDTDVTHMDPAQDNNGCIVAHLVYGKTSVLLTCDATKIVEDYLLAIASLPTGQAGSSELASDILKVGHHGSKYSTGDAFVAAVHPSVALISVGAHNPYGHPTQQVLDILAAHNIPVLRTDQDGTLIFKSNGEKFVRE